MPGLKQVLESDETVLCRARCHWWWNLRSLGLQNLFNHFVVTDRRILHKTGILSANVRSMALAQVESRDIDQSIWGRLFGFGDLLVCGSGGKEFRICNIADPNGVARAIGLAVAAHHGAEVGGEDQVKPWKTLRRGKGSPSR